MNGIIGKFYYGAEWVLRAMYLHLLWLLFTILGLGIFGFMPATAAVFAVNRKWINGETDIPLFSYFLQIYKSSWKTANLIGFCFLMFSIFLYIDFRVSQVFIGSIFFHVLLLFISTVSFITFVYFFPVCVHYDLKPFQYLRQALLLSLAQPLYLLGILLWIFVSYIISHYIPVLYLFMGITITSFPIMWLSMFTFRKVEKKLGRT